MLLMMYFLILGGRTGVTMQPLGTSSTRVSTAPSHHSPRFGMPVNEQSRSSMLEAMAVLAASGNAVSPGKGDSCLCINFLFALHGVHAIKPEIYCIGIYLVLCFLSNRIIYHL